MQKYVADIYQKSIYVIDYDKLKKKGIKCLIYDLDNTLVPPSVDKPTKKVIDLVYNLKEKGFKVIIMSNSPKNRLEPFKEILDIDCCAFACKPLKRNFLKILNKYNLKNNEVAIIGDQLCTDILGGNKVGITTILINSISKKELTITKFNRLREIFILNKLRKKNLFFKGKYYE